MTKNTEKYNKESGKLARSKKKITDTCMAAYKVTDLEKKRWEENQGKGHGKRNGELIGFTL